MRIAFIVNSYPPRLGGLESHIYHLSVSLAQLGHEVFVLTISDKPGHRQEEGVDIRTDRRHFPVADIISFPARARPVRSRASCVSTTSMSSVCTLVFSP